MKVLVLYLSTFTCTSPHAWYMYCPVASVVSVVYDVLSLPTVVQLLPELLSQEYTIVPIPLALHVKVIVPFTGTLSPTGCSRILGGPVNNNNQDKCGNHFSVLYGNA